MDDALCCNWDPTGAGVKAELLQVNSQRSASANPSVSLATTLRSWVATSAVLTSLKLRGGEISRPVPLFHCRRPKGTTGSSAMQYLAQPWFLHHGAVPGASLMISYRDVLDDLVRQSRHRHSLLRRARVWTTSADQHYQRHNRRVQLFSVMS